LKNERLTKIFWLRQYFSIISLPHTGSLTLRTSFLDAFGKCLDLLCGEAGRASQSLLKWTENEWNVVTEYRKQRETRKDRPGKSLTSGEPDSSEISEAIEREKKTPVLYFLMKDWLPLSKGTYSAKTVDSSSFKLAFFQVTLLRLQRLMQFASSSNSS
jgi:hypothetical protein